MGLNSQEEISCVTMFKMICNDQELIEMDLNDYEQK